MGQCWPRASQEAYWGSGRPKDSGVGARAVRREVLPEHRACSTELRRLAFGGTGELGGTRGTAGLYSVGETEFSCTRIVSSEVQTVIPASGDGRGTHGAVVKSEGDLSPEQGHSRIRGGMAQVISAGSR